MSPPRAYRSGLRAEQSAAVRERVLDAAADLFAERGYLGSTVADVARRAGVSVQTVYNAVGGKPELLKVAYDRAIAGDDEPVPMSERPQVQAMIAATDARSALGHYARLGRDIAERSHRVVGVAYAQVAAGDAALADFTATLDHERLVGARATARHLATRFGLPDGVDETQAADVLWAATAPELATRLVTARGWDWDRYESWLAATLTGALVPDAAQRR